LPAQKTNGPDMIDIETMMRAIEALHGGAVKLAVSPAGIGPTGGLAVVLSYSTAAVGVAGLAEDLVIVNRWPCPIHRDFWSCVFEGLYRLDSAIGRNYTQRTLEDT
jgi:hypothetical protein